MELDAHRDTSAERLPVSVVIPAYNRAHTLERALDSVATQRPHPPAEVIVVDDCSTDRTGSVAARRGATVVRHEVNRGEGASRNTGLAAAQHEWVALLDSDDEWLPHHLATLWPLRDGHVLVAGSTLWCTDDGRSDRVGGVPGHRPIVLRSPAALVYPENFIGPSAVLLRKSVSRSVGGFKPLPFAADMDLWIRMIERGTALASPVVVALWHRHEEQVTTNARATWAGGDRVAQSYADRPWASKALYEKARAVIAWDSLRLAIRTHRRADGISQLVAIISRPRRIAAVAGMILRRERLKRSASRISRDGRPTVAILPGPARAARQRALAAGCEVFDLSDDAKRLRALARLAARPTGAAVSSSRLERRFLEKLGIRALTPDAVDRSGPPGPFGGG